MLRVIVVGFLLGQIAIAHAAEIRRYVYKGLTFYEINGALEPEDASKFTEIATDERAIVFLASPGGSVGTAITIGEHIRMKGYSTFVEPDKICASGCGLIWLAGKPRGGTESSKIGFHAASRNGEVASSGNALIGAYLNKIGMSYRAVAYITSTSPADMTWLTFDRAKDLGIDIAKIDLPSREPVGLGGKAVGSGRPDIAGQASADRPTNASSVDIRLSCSPIVREGKDPVVIVEVSRVKDFWTIVHVSASGARYDRGEQYNISRKPGARYWTGKHKKKLDVSMVGEISVRDKDFYYNERVYSNDTLVADIESKCALKN